MGGNDDDGAASGGGDVKKGGDEKRKRDEKYRRVFLFGHHPWFLYDEFEDEAEMLAGIGAGFSHFAVHVGGAPALHLNKRRKCGVAFKQTNKQTNKV